MGLNFDRISLYVQTFTFIVPFLLAGRFSVRAVGL